MCSADNKKREYEVNCLFHVIIFDLFPGIFEISIYGFRDAGIQTLYVRDASGNVMAVYANGRSSNVMMLRELHMYGSSRLGIVSQEGSNGLPVTYTEVDLHIDYGKAKGHTFERTRKLFELSNHLGNVLTTITDKRHQVDDDEDDVVDYYTADVASATDYYPGGMQMPGREYNATTDYRYGFNGKEKDTEGPVQYDYGFRIYDPRLVRFKSVDPLANDFAWNSPYSYSEGDPVNFIDLDGLEKPDQTAQANPNQANRNQLRVVRSEQAKVIPLNAPGRPQFRPRVGLSPFTAFINNLGAVKQFNDDWADYMLHNIQQLKTETTALQLELQQIQNEKAQLQETAVVSYDLKMMATTEREEGKERKKDMYVYRGGSFSDANFTPREQDTEPGPKQGLSTFVTALQAAQGSTNKVQVLSVKKLLKLGFSLNVTLDGHVGIIPKSQRALKVWAKSGEAVLRGEKPHLLTKILKKARVKEEKVKK